MEMHFKKKIALFWAGITYICLCLEVLGKHQKQYVLVALLLFSVLLVLIVGTGKKTKEKFTFKAVLLVVVMLELIYQGWAEYAPQAGGYVEEFAKNRQKRRLFIKYNIMFCKNPSPSAVFLTKPANLALSAARRYGMMW